MVLIENALKTLQYPWKSQNYLQCDGEDKVLICDLQWTTEEL